MEERSCPLLVSKVFVNPNVVGVKKSSEFLCKNMEMDHVMYNSFREERFGICLW